MPQVINSKRIKREVVAELETILKRKAEDGIVMSIEQFMGMYCGALEAERAYVSPSGLNKYDLLNPLLENEYVSDYFGLDAHSDISLNFKRLKKQVTVFYRTFYEPIVQTRNHCEEAPEYFMNNVVSRLHSSSRERLVAEGDKFGIAAKEEKKYYATNDQMFPNEDYAKSDLRDHKKVFTEWFVLANIFGGSAYLLLNSPLTQGTHLLWEGMAAVGIVAQQPQAIQAMGAAAMTMTQASMATSVLIPLASVVAGTCLFVLTYAFICMAREECQDYSWVKDRVVERKSREKEEREHKQKYGLTKDEYKKIDLDFMDSMDDIKRVDYGKNKLIYFNYLFNTMLNPDTTRFVSNNPELHEKMRETGQAFVDALYAGLIREKNIHDRAIGTKIGYVVDQTWGRGWRAVSAGVGFIMENVGRWTRGPGDIWDGSYADERFSYVGADYSFFHKAHWEHLEQVLGTTHARKQEAKMQSTSGVEDLKKATTTCSTPNKWQETEDRRRSEKQQTIYELS